MCPSNSSRRAARSSFTSRASIIKRPRRHGKSSRSSRSRNFRMRLDGRGVLKPTSRIYVAGGDTLIGAALRAELRSAGCENVLAPAAEKLNLADGRQVEEFFAAERPEYVFLAAGKSGGIRANQMFSAVLMRDNLL